MDKKNKNPHTQEIINDFGGIEAFINAHRDNKLPDFNSII